jgi:hypothetical protein
MHCTTTSGKGVEKTSEVFPINTILQLNPKIAALLIRLMGHSKQRRNAKQ